MSRLLALFAVLTAPFALAEEVAPAPPAAAPAKARLATWRAQARPPADVPPAAIVRAAARKDEKADLGRRTAGASNPSVEIIWHAPGT